MKLEFKPEDYEKGFEAVAPNLTPYMAAVISNRRLAEMLAEAPTQLGSLVNPPNIKSFLPKCVHSVIYAHDITHTAKLVDIREIEK